MNVFQGLRSVAVKDVPCIEWDLTRARAHHKDNWIIRLVGFAGMLPTDEADLDAVMARPNVELQILLNDVEMSRSSAKYLDARSILRMVAEAGQTGYEFA